MAEEPKITLQIRTLAETSGVDKATDSLEGLGEAGKDAATALESTTKAVDGVNEGLKETGGAADAAADALKGTGKAAETVGKTAEKAVDAAADAMGDAASTAKEKLDDVAEEAKEAGKRAGEGLKEEVEKATSKIVWTQDTLNAAEKAWQLGTIIGEELAKAVAYTMDRGSLDGFFDTWITELAAKFGLATDTWSANLKKVKEAGDLALVEGRKQYEDWLTSLSKAPAQDAITWLKILKDDAQNARDALKDLQQLQAAVRRANMDRIGQDEADALDKIDADPVLSDGQKIRERQRIKTEAEQRRLNERIQGRAEQGNESFQNILGAKDDLQRKRDIEEMQKERARQWSQMRDEAVNVSKRDDGTTDETTAGQQFDIIAKRKGVTDMSYADDEQAKEKKAKAAREEAEAALAEAERQHNALRRRLSVEDNADIENTGRNVQRGNAQAERQTRAADQRDADAAKAAADEQTRAEQERLQGIGNEAAGRAVTDMAALRDAATNPQIKEQLSQLLTTLTDADGATAQDVKRVIAYLESLKTSSAEGQRQMISTLSGMLEVQKNFSSQIQSLQGEINGMKARSFQ